MIVYVYFSIFRETLFVKAICYAVTRLFEALQLTELYRQAQLIDTHRREK